MLLQFTQPGLARRAHQNHAGGVNEEKPSKVPPVVRKWWTLPVFLGLLGFEWYRVQYGGYNPDWVWIGIAVLGLVFIVLVNVLGYRK